MICPYCKKEIEPIEETISEISIEKDPPGRIKIWTEITKDAEGKQIHKRIDEYLYYPSGEIDTIIQKVYGLIDSPISKEMAIKHFQDGRQPVCSTIK